NDLAAAELHFLTIDGVVLLDLDDQLGVGQTDAIAGGRAVVAGVSGTRQTDAHAETPVGPACRAGPDDTPRNGKPPPRNPHRACRFASCSPGPARQAGPTCASSASPRAGTARAVRSSPRGRACRRANPSPGRCRRRRRAVRPSRPGAPT